MKVPASWIPSKKFILLSIAIAILASLYIYRERVVLSFFGGGLVFNGSDSMDIERVSLGKRNFCTPRAYFLFSNALFHEKGFGVDLAMDIEGLQPWLIYGRKSGFFDKKKDMSQMEINEYLSRQLRLTVGNTSASAKNKTWEMMLKGARVEEHGKYKRLWKTDKTLMRFDYVLLPKEAEDYSKIIACISGARCTLDARYDSDISYVIGFDESYLGVIDEINTRVRSFIGRSFCK